MFLPELLFSFSVTPDPNPFFSITLTLPPLSWKESYALSGEVIILVAVSIKYSTNLYQLKEPQSLMISSGKIVVKIACHYFVEE